MSAKPTKTVKPAPTRKPATKESEPPVVAEAPPVDIPVAVSVLPPTVDATEETPVDIEPAAPPVVPEATPTHIAEGVQQEVPADPVLRLSRKARRHATALLQPYFSSQVLADNIDRILAHVESGQCAVVLNTPWGVELAGERFTTPSAVFAARYEARFEFELSDALRRAQVL